MVVAVELAGEGRRPADYSSQADRSLHASSHTATFFVDMHRGGPDAAPRAKSPQAGRAPASRQAVHTLSAVADRADLEHYGRVPGFDS